MVWIFTRRNDVLSQPANCANCSRRLFMLGRETSTGSALFPRESIRGRSYKPFVRQRLYLSHKFVSDSTSPRTLLISRTRGAGYRRHFTNPSSNSARLSRRFLDITRNPMIGASNPQPICNPSPRRRAAGVRAPPR
jgi:hypothetical protein